MTVCSLQAQGLQNENCRAIARFENREASECGNRGSAHEETSPSRAEQTLLTPIDQKKGGHPKPGSCDPRHSRRDSQPGTVQVPIWVICRVNLFCCRRFWQRFCTMCSVTIRSLPRSRKRLWGKSFNLLRSVRPARTILILHRDDWLRTVHSERGSGSPESNEELQPVIHSHLLHG